MDAADWGTVRAELDAYGCALTRPPLTRRRQPKVAALYPDDSRFRATLESTRGWSAAPVRHGVSVIRSGQRFTLGLVFHDAA